MIVGHWKLCPALEFREDKVARERIYVMDAWEAPEWRADTPADPPDDISPM